MQRHKRFAWTWAAAGTLAVAGLLGACEPDTDVPAPGPDAGTQQSADSGTQPVDAGTDAGTPDAGAVVTLPLAVDGTWAASGYMGDGANNLLQDSAECAATRPGTAKGNCHKFTWTPGMVGWAGVWWQYPDGNWGTNANVAGFEVPAGATSLSFYAWGGTGGEVVTFLVGMSAAVDGFNLELKDVALTAEPKQYTIDLSRVRYQKVVGGFGWVAGGRTTPLVLFIDDIQWR
ncbi:hypothetical protein ACLESD_21920 [Pyxidicoccus sp. 3LFB2]